MAYIPNLSTTPTLSGGYYFLVAKGNANNAQRVSAQEVADFVAETLSIGGITSHYAAPSSTAFSVELPDVTNTIWLILTPTGTFADGEIVMPSAPVDQQTVTVNCTQIVTTFVVDGNGATVTGEPSTLAANGFFSLRYDAVANVWYRIS
jgi:hypothetical protein